MIKVHALAQYRDLDKADLNVQRDVGNILDSFDSKCCRIFDFSLAISYYLNNCNLRVSAHRQFVSLQNFVKSSLGRIFAKDLRFCEQLLQKIKVNTIAEEGRT